MSEENVEIVRRAFEALNREDLDALVEAYDPEARQSTPGPSWLCDSECTCLPFSPASREISDPPRS